MKRNKQHQIDSRAQAIFRNFAPDYWSLQEPSEDYGIDYYVQVFDEETGRPKPIFFSIQLKGTEELTENDDFVKFNFKTDTLKYYLKDTPFPVFLVLVETKSERIYYIFLQEYINGNLNLEKPNWINQKTVTVYIPKTNTFDSGEIDNIAKNGMKYCGLLVNGYPSFDLETKVKGIVDNPIEKGKALNEKYSAIFLEETKIGIELLDQENEIVESEKKFQSVFNKTKNDADNVEIHLKALIAIISLQDFSSVENEKLLNCIEYGLNLSIDYKIYYLAHFFTGFKLEKYFYDLNEKIIYLNFMLNTLENFKDSLNQIIYLDLFEDLNECYKFLVKIYDDYYKNMILSLENEEWSVFCELLYRFINMNFFNISINLYKFDSKELRPLFINTKGLIKIFENITNDMGVIAFKYQLLEIKSRYYYLNDDKKCIKIAREYMGLAKNNNSKNQYEIAKSLKEFYENKPISRLLNNKRKNEISDEEIENFYKELFLSENIDIENDDGKIANILKIGLRDRNPERVLKNCENMEIEYKAVGIPARVYGLYSAGFKKIFCKYAGAVEGMELDDIYHTFEKEWCVNCEHKKPRDEEWKWSIK